MQVTDLHIHKNPEQIRNFTTMDERQVYMGAPSCPFLSEKFARLKEKGMRRENATERSSFPPSWKS